MYYITVKIWEKEDKLEGDTFREVLQSVLDACACRGDGVEPNILMIHDDNDGVDFIWPERKRGSIEARIWNHIRGNYQDNRSLSQKEIDEACDRYKARRQG